MNDTPKVEVIERAEVGPQVYVELCRVGDAYTVRQKDEEAGELVSLTRYPSERAAREGYRGFVRRALGAKVEEGSGNE